MHDCLTLVISRGSLESKSGPAPIVTRHSIAEAKKGKIRILLAEDNIVNQKVALRHLEKMGYRADAVANGKEVLAALEKIPYDLIFMDVQMPEMDGFEATAAIRKKESGTEGHIPIIAMTAHAMKGYRERCVETGMDDYISKPIRPQVLFEVVDRWVHKAGSGEQEIPSIPPSEGSEVFDKGVLLELFDGDKALFSEVLGAFLKNAPMRIDKMREHLKEKNLAGLQFQAHSLKGAAMNIGGKALQKVSLDIEAAAKNGELDKAEQLVAAIGREFERLETTLVREV